MSFGFESLELINFRSYSRMIQNFSKSTVVFYGDNGAGKTNILEAISFLSPYQGFRKAKLSDVVNQNNKSQGWSITGEIKTLRFPLKIQINMNFSFDGRCKKDIIINDKKIKKKYELLDYLNIVWLTPQMDKFFIDQPSIRRKFFDHFISSFDGQFHESLNNYEHYVSQRLTLLKQENYDENLLNILEEKIVLSGVAVSAKRLEVVDLFNAVTTEQKINKNFPRPILKVCGVIEEMLVDKSALETEDYYRVKLYENRMIDQYLGKTTFGIHKMDYETNFEQKQFKANLCSTGEQKALLLSIIISAVKILVSKKKGMPILLLDEVLAHIDHARRSVFLNYLKELGIQIFITGTDKHYFQNIFSFADVFHIEKSSLIMRQ